MTLDNLIEKAIIDVKYYQERLREPEEIPNFKGCMDALDELKNITK